MSLTERRGARRINYDPVVPKAAWANCDKYVSGERTELELRVLDAVERSRGSGHSGLTFDEIEDRCRNAKTGRVHVRATLNAALRALVVNGLLVCWRVRDPWSGRGPLYLLYAAPEQLESFLKKPKNTNMKENSKEGVNHDVPTEGKAGAGVA